MKKTAIAVLLFCFMGTYQLSAQNSVTSLVKEKYTVAESISSLKGEWRFMYKIIEDQIVYNRSFRHGAKGYMQIDTMEIHTYNIDALGRTEYYVDWENPDGTVIQNEANFAGSWDIEKISSSLDLVIKDAYFKGCPDIRRRIEIINKQQMLLLDVDTGDKFYYKRYKK